MLGSPMAQRQSEQNAPSRAAKFAPWLGLLSLSGAQPGAPWVVGLLGPIAIVLGIVARGQGRRDPAKARPVREMLAIGAGALGTVLFVVSAIVGAFKGGAAPELSEGLTASTPPAASSADTERTAIEARRRADEAREERERTAAVTKAAKALAADQSAVRASLDAGQAALDKHNVSGARKELAGLAPRFLPLDRAYLIPDDSADSATRDALRAATELLTRYEQENAAVEQQRTAAYNAAFETLWTPANARRNDDALLAGVGRKFGLSLDDMKALMLEHDAESTTRLRERGDTEAKARQEQATAAIVALEAECGPKPTRSPLDSGLPAAEAYVKTTAHDRGSIDVENCTDPVVSAGVCWMTVCDVRGKNALGAKVLTRMRFTLTKNVVTGAQAL